MKKKSSQPSEWQSHPIGTHCKVVRGSSPRPAGSPLYFDGNFLPWITVADVTRRPGMYLSSTRTMLTEDGAKLTRILQPGTLILSNSGATLGVPKIVSIEAGANDGIAAFIDLEGLEKSFLFYVLEQRTDFMRKHLAPGNGQPNLNTDIISSIHVPVPPLPEQRIIAAIFSTWDRAIELIEKLIAAKQKRKQALMQQLLTRKARLPGFKKSNWKQLHLDDVAKNSTQRNGVPTDSRTVYSVTNSVGMVPMDESVIGESIDRYKTVSRFDFAYNPMRINVGSIAMWDGDEDVLVSPDYVVFRCGSKLDPQFLNHFRRTHYWRHFVNRAGGGSVRVRIYFSDLGSMKLNLPSIEEQKAIANVLNAQDGEIGLLTRKSDALKRQKKGLMQQLLTGKVRVLLSEFEDSHVKY